MSQDESISVVIPVYNGARYLSEAINSALDQTLAPAEIVIIDDGSIDHSGDIARGYGGAVKYFYQANAGIGAARNRGVTETQSEWIAFLDADDLWMPEKLHLQMDARRTSQPPADIVLGQIMHFISPDLNETDVVRYRCPQGLQAGYHAGAMLIRRAHFLAVGYFDTNLKSGEFIEWLLRARAYGLKELVIPQLVMKRRIHGDNYTLKHDRLNQDYLNMVKTILQSRKKIGSEPE